MGERVTPAELLEALTACLEANDHRSRSQQAVALVDGPLVPLVIEAASFRAERDVALAALQQVTAERDAEKARADRIDAKLGELNAAVRECLPPVDTLIAEREAAEAALATATATAEAAGLRAERDDWHAAADSATALTKEAVDVIDRLRAEVEAKDRAILLLLPFVDYAAGEGLAFIETEDGEHPEMVAADIMAAAAEVLGLELGSDAYLALLPAGYDAIRAARAATAREG